MVLRCLIVDDSSIFQRAARTLLEQTGMTVSIASTGEQARRLIAEVRPDVVLVDIDLGPENGFDVAVRLCVQPYGAGGPPQIILISSHGEEDFEELIAESPARGFINKSSLSAAAIRSLVDGDA